MKVADYLIRDKLSQGKRFSVYRAINENNSVPYILKCLEKEAGHNLNLINALKHEYHFLKQVDSEYVIKAVDWIDDKDYTILALEDIDGSNLKDQLKKAPFPVKQFIELAVLIANGLAAIHTQNIIHKDINPSNIIWNSQTGNLKIIDFNIASKFNIKVSYLGNPEKLQGTLPYLSPEQTGRMNRRVDHRTDLYSLGVTFYEMLTGQLPFGHRSPMEIVYAHLARDPEPPHLVNEQVPEILSNIVLKLLAKSPEERYQSADGLKHDLEILQKAFPKLEGLAKIQLGEKDFSGKLQIPERLYGREKEIEQLLSAYQGVSKGAKDMVLVAGYSGTGKTALVNAIHKPITKDRGYFINGKFDQLQRMIPYFAFIQALNRFCDLLLTERQEVLVQWKERILQAVGELGKVLTDIIPQLESVIGKQPEVPEVGGDEVRKRFNYVFQRFLQAVSTEEHPLVIFIDDLQWVDLASLSLLQELMEDKQIRYLLFIGAYRDNEVSPSHPLMTTLEKIHKQDIGVQNILVKNLSLQNVREWLRDTLNIESDSGLQAVTSLANLIYQKTQGNAFFTIQFLENLYKENLLDFDFKQSKWTWDVIEIEKQNITDNVVDLLVRKIQMLPTEGQEALKLAACIGNVFDLRTLSVISEKSKKEREGTLEIALSEHLIYPLEDESYKFVHDRIHQAAYSLISVDSKKPLHLKIGRLLLKNFEVSETSKVSKEAEQHIFEIVNHLNTGIDLIEEKKEKIQLAQLNLKAGQNAKKSAAFKLGSDYVNTAIELLPKDCWQQYYDLTLAVYSEAIETSYLCQKFEEMDKYADTLLKSAGDISHRSVAYECRIMSLITQSQETLAAERVLSIFSSFGVNIPRSPGKLQTIGILLKTHAMLKRKGVESLKDLPLMSDPQQQLVQRLLYVGAVAFVFGAQELMPIVTSKMVGLILKYGLTPETPFILAFYGIIRIFMGDTAGAYQLGEIAKDILDKRVGHEGIKVKTLLVIYLYLHGNKQHYKKTCKLLMDSYPYALNVGDFEYAGYILANYVVFILRTDTELTVLKEKVQNIKDKIVQIKQSILLNAISMETAFISNLLGETSDPVSLDIDEEGILQNMEGGSKILFICQVNVRKIILGYLFEKHDNILEYIKVLEDSWKYLTTPLTFVKSDFHFYIPLVYLQLYDNASGNEKKKYLSKVKKNTKIMEKWSTLGPINFLHKYYLMQAELYRVTGKTRQAAEYYDKAIEKAYENEYINEAAIANELAAKFCMQKNQHKLAALYFMEAKNCYHKWGAKAKVKHLDEKYPKYLSMRIPASTLTTGTISSYSTDTTSELLDVKSIIKATQTLSGEVQLKNLLEKMMQILIKNAGAQKSLLLENTGEGLLIQAEGSTDGISGILQALPAEKSGKVPLSVINYVAHSKQKLAFDNVSKDPNYSADNYIQKHQSKSVVCFPILSKGELSAIIYLENNLVEGAFTPARLEILNMLSAQIAISVENTRLYENLEEKVKQRTIALQNAHQQLEKNLEALEESHKKINDSVNYASRIQNAVLPDQETLAKLLPQHFILYRPCAGVSGDFYWVRQIDQKIITAAADCTGHGVPGALVSMLGAAFLNEIIPHLAAQSQLTAGKILDELRTKVKIALKQIGQISDQKEGMDIALCIIDLDKKQLQYAGAHHPLYLIRDNQLTEIKADKMPIAIHRKEQPFTSHDIPYQKGDMIYLFSDGFVDQFSEKKKEKFMRKNFKKLLIEINQEPVTKQKEILINGLEEWKGNLPQVDDILIFGIRL